MIGVSKLLNVYQYDEYTESYVAHSEGGAQTNPVRTLHNPRELAVVEKKLFVSNDNPLKYYTGVTLKFLPVALTLSNSNGFEYKILQSDAQPSAAEWAAVLSGNVVTIGGIGDSDAADQSFVAFWIQISLPRSTTQATYTNVNINVHYDTEAPVVP